MQRNIRIAFGSLFLLIISCKEPQWSESADVQAWRLSWDLWYAIKIQDDHRRAIVLFDSLIEKDYPVEGKFLALGLQTLQEIGDTLKLKSCLKKITDDSLNFSSTSEVDKFLQSFLSSVRNQTVPEIAYPEIRDTLIHLLVNDQYVRGQSIEDIEREMEICIADSVVYPITDGVSVDFMNRERLKNIIENYGFPDVFMVGEVGMEAVWLVLQHSDGDFTFQEKYLQEIEKQAFAGQIPKQYYAYLYDRVKINSNQKQLYGTQVSTIDHKNHKIKFYAIADSLNLDKRRMEMGIMPIDLYVQLMLHTE